MTLLIVLINMYFITFISLVSPSYQKVNKGFCRLIPGSAYSITSQLLVKGCALSTV